MKRASRVLHTASVWAPLLLSSVHALADDAPPQKTQTAKPDTESRSNRGNAAQNPATPKANAEHDAAAAYQTALESYSKGDVAAALDSMRQSYQLSKRPELLYNLAQLLEELKVCNESLADYRQYLELVPHGRHREAAERATERLAHECPSPTAVSAPGVPGETVATGAAAPKPATDERKPKQPPVDPAPTSYWTTRRAIGWSAIATGTLMGGGALYFELAAIQAKRDYQKSVDDEQNGGAISDPSLQDRQHRNEKLALALAITGGALVAGGTLVLLLDPGKHSHSASASVYALPGLVGACYAQRF